MIKIENADVWGFEHAIRGARNPMNSWDKSDSEFYINGDGNEFLAIGQNDMKLLTNLLKASSDGNFAHRKFMRQIFCSVDITAPLYWWKEMDQYKIGTTTDSCSTMHKIASKEFELDDFSHEHLTDEITNAYYETGNEHNICINGVLSYSWMVETVAVLNAYRELYLESKDKDYWWQLIQLLPSSYNQKRTWTGSYENLLTMHLQRVGHKLDEWNILCEWIETLPYMKEFIKASRKD